MYGVDWLELFYETIGEDSRISTTHISVYLALMYEWSRAGQSNYLAIDRNTIMRRAKISSPTTYNSSLHALHDFGYVDYLPVAGMGQSCIRIRKL